MTADLRVDLDVAVRDGSLGARRHVRHELRDSTVHATGASGVHVEERTFAVEGWRSELSAACRVAIPAGAAAPPADGVAVPWDLVIGTGAALREHRTDAYDVLVCRADVAFREPLRRLHLAVGRLRAVGTLPARRSVGWVSWVLFDDGWRALTPYVDRGPGGSRAMVRVEHRRPEDLATDVARWASAVPR